MRSDDAVNTCPAGPKLAETTGPLWESTLSQEPVPQPGTPIAGAGQYPTSNATNAKHSTFMTFQSEVTHAGLRPKPWHDSHEILSGPEYLRSMQRCTEESYGLPVPRRERIKHAVCSVGWHLTRYPPHCHLCGSNHLGPLALYPPS